MDPFTVFLIAGLVIFAVFFKEFKHGKLILKVIAGLAILWVIFTLLDEILLTIHTISWWF